MQQPLNAGARKRVTECFRDGDADVVAMYTEEATEILETAIEDAKFCRETREVDVVCEILGTVPTEVDAEDVQKIGHYTADALEALDAENASNFSGRIRPAFFPQSPISLLKDHDFHTKPYSRDLPKSPAQLYGSDTFAHALVEIGGQDWQHKNMHRLYFNNLEDWFFENSEDDWTEDLSKSKLKQLRLALQCGKVFYDVGSKKFFTEIDDIHGLDTDVFRNTIVNAITAAAELKQKEAAND